MSVWMTEGLCPVHYPFVVPQTSVSSDQARWSTTLQRDWSSLPCYKETWPPVQSGDVWRCMQAGVRLLRKWGRSWLNRIYRELRHHCCVEVTVAVKSCAHWRDTRSWTTLTLWSDLPNVFVVFFCNVSSSTASCTTPCDRHMYVLQTWKWSLSKLGIRLLWWWFCAKIEAVESPSLKWCPAHWWSIM